MKEVNISELKARLSHYLRLVEDGEEILVKDRRRPVARLVSCQRSAKPAIGEPRRVSREEAAKIFASLPPPKLSQRTIKESLHWMELERSRRAITKK